MRLLSEQEIATVGGSKLADINYVIDKTFGFGAFGVLIKAVTIANPSFGVLAHAFAVGAGIGAIYGVVKSAFEI